MNTHVLRIIRVVCRLRIQYNVAMVIKLEIGSYILSKNAFCFFWFDNKT